MTFQQPSKPSNTSPTCLICGRSTLEATNLQARDYLSNNQFTLARCVHCQCLMTMDAQQDQKHDYYGENYYNASSGKFSTVIEKIFRLNHARNARYFHTHFPSTNILEVGCGRGYLLKELKRLGATVFCLESADAADWILDNPDIQVATLPESQSNRWPFADDFFQLIIFWHVLEHLSDPAGSLKQAFCCLALGGTVCVSVPNVSSLQARLHLTTWFHLDVPRHLYHFSQTGLVFLLEKQGYEIIKITAGDRMQNLFGWLQSLANLFTPGHINSFYRLLQGGKPLRGVNILSLAIQLLTCWIWIPLGMLGFLMEEITKKHATITVYAKKPDHDNK
ncbi:MAG: class I SAM-dependent methyltransferase [Proteobacteria bacterium]|nr:class I SAM-dependent methyltransferase [Pseudomonadota bacterium]MBU1648811.1 class I SAM-dependent methyltransferase [Pseudomonadota bacterium]